jgi:hypothetical protein
MADFGSHIETQNGCQVKRGKEKGGQDGEDGPHI